MLTNIKFFYFGRVTKQSFCRIFVSHYLDPETFPSKISTDKYFSLFLFESLFGIFPAFAFITSTVPNFVYPRKYSTFGKKRIHTVQDQVTTQNGLIHFLGSAFWVGALS